MHATDVYYPSLEPHKTAKKMAVVLDSMRSGMPAFIEVFDAFQSKYGKQFKTDFIREVSR